MNSNKQYVSCILLEDLSSPVDEPDKPMVVHLDSTAKWDHKIHVDSNRPNLVSNLSLVQIVGGHTVPCSSEDNVTLLSLI